MLEEIERVCVTDAVDVYDALPEDVYEEEPVLDDVSFGTRVTVADSVMFVEDVVHAEVDGDDELDLSDVYVLRSDGDTRIEADTVLVIVDVLDFDVVALDDPVDVTELDPRDETLSFVVVDVFVEVNVNVPVRVCRTVAVSRGYLLVVNVTRILGDAVVVAVCVFVASRLLLGVDVELGVLVCIADRVKDGDALAVFVEPTDRVAEKVIGIVSVVFDVLD